MRRSLKGLVLSALLMFGASAWSQWELDSDKSSIHFWSTKNSSITETHGFSSFSGSISHRGDVQVNIDLASVETSIPIRNQRMRELLFKTTQFPNATITATIAPDTIAAIAIDGAVFATEILITVHLHGLSHPLKIPVTVSRDGSSLQVVSASPVILHATDFNLGHGVAALREIAGLASISTDIPVTVNLLFSREPSIGIP